MQIALDPGKKIYFASDFHLGFPNATESKVREKLLVHWLEAISHDAQHIFLLGDIFDFWFDYRFVVPQSFVRFQGQIARLTDQGLPITFFTGNHDMWMFGYLTSELGVPIYREPLSLKIGEHIFHIGHGDGLGPGDYSYKFLKSIFRNRFFQRIFSAVPPTLGMGLAMGWSKQSKKKKMGKGVVFEGEKELIWQYCQKIERQNHHDFYIFGHRHLPMELKTGERSVYFNLGDWLSYNTFAVYNGTSLQLQSYTQPYVEVHRM